MRLYDTRNKKTSLGTQFGNIFKTYIGGGEHEIYELSSLIHYRDTPTVQQEVVRENVITRYANVPLDYTSTSNSSIYCHLDVSELKPSELLRTSLHNSDDGQVVTINDNSIPSYERWLNNLLICMNKFSIVDMTDRDTYFPAYYLSQFMYLFDRAVAKIDDREAHLFFVYNTIKKINILLRAMVKKGEYVMNYNDKLKFNQLTGYVFDVWNNMVRMNSTLFTSLQLIAVDEIRQEFGCVKSETLQNIYELFYLMNTPKKWTVSKKRYKGTRYACEFLFKVYELTLGSILFANLKLIAMAPDDNKLTLFSALLKAFREENNAMSALHKTCPSRTALHSISQKIVEFIFTLNTDFAALIRGLYSRYEYREERYQQVRNHPSFVFYSMIPAELEGALDTMDLLDPTAAHKFSLFMFDQFDQIQQAVQLMNSLVTPITRDESVQRVVKKYRQKQQQGNTSGSNKRPRTTAVDASSSNTQNKRKKM
jgi:hypothetical protein